MAIQDELNMAFNYEPITYKDIKEGAGRPATEKAKAVLKNVRKGERTMELAWNRTYNEGNPHKAMWFNHVLIYPENVLPTVAGDHGGLWDYEEQSQVSDKSIANASSFPQDYQFTGGSVPYICGMSVPPLMIKRVVGRLLEQGVLNAKR